MLIRRSIAGVFLVSLAGCTFEPNIIAASVEHSSAENATVHVRLNSDDALSIKRKQFYFSIVTINCDDGSNKFPMEPYVAGQRATEFKFPVSDGQVDVTGEIPVRLLERYRKPCVFVEGGGYLTGKVRSKPIPLVSNR